MEPIQSQRIERKQLIGKVPDHRHVSVLQLTLQGMLRRTSVQFGIVFVCHKIGRLVAWVVVSDGHGKWVCV
jgi:hypothetical protein